MATCLLKRIEIYFKAIVVIFFSYALVLPDVFVVKKGFTRPFGLVYPVSQRSAPHSRPPYKKCCLTASAGVFNTAHQLEPLMDTPANVFLLSPISITSKIFFHILHPGLAGWALHLAGALCAPKIENILTRFVWKLRHEL